MQVIERNLTGKRDQKTCEDAIVESSNFIAVVDGSTSKAKRQRSLFHKNGWTAMKTVCRTIERADKAISVEEFCRQATQDMRKKYAKRELPTLADHPEERLCASCIIYSRLRRQIWMVGDCQCLVDGQYFDNPKPAEAHEAQIRAEYNCRLLTEGRATVEQLMDDDQGRTAMMPSLLESMKGENIDYAVIDGFPIPMGKVRVLTLDFSPHEVVLASDGYPFLRPTLEESETALARLLRDDPLCIRQFLSAKGLMNGQKSFDDRAYIRFKV